jgi:photosystem II stability/assembly factor-like uncharacterized protein
MTIPQPFMTESGGQPTQQSLPFPVTRQFGQTSYSLKDVDFISVDDGWAVGEPHWDQSLRAYTGTILKTADGGLTWNPQTVDVAETLRNVDFIDGWNGWAVGDNGTILHTSDGGENWNRQSIDSQDYFRGVSFVSASEGWASSFHSNLYNPVLEEDVNWEGAIWHTEDGGNTWREQSLPAGASLMNRIKFLNAQEGWAVGIKYLGGTDPFEIQHSGVVYHTTNGGENWEELSIFDSLDLIFTAVDWSDSDHGWVAGFPKDSSIKGGCVFHTSDGGITWERQQPECDVFAPIWDMQFVDANRGYAVGFDYISAWGPPVYRTMDSGETWEKVKMEKHDSEGLFGLSIVGDQAIIVGENDYLARSNKPWETTDCGNYACLFTQSYLNPHYKFHDVFFADGQNGWAVGSKNYSPAMWGQVILHTADGGNNWEIQYEKAPLPILFSNDRLESVYFVDSQNGWASGTYASPYEPTNFLLHTTDGGKHWTVQGRELCSEGDYCKPEFSSVQFLDPLNGWALATNDIQPGKNTIALAHTLDGGEHWNWVDSELEGMLQIGFLQVQSMLSFPDAQHGWATGGRYDLISTADGGTTWTRQSLMCEGVECIVRVYAVSFFNERNGWVVGEELFHTTNGGQSWTQIAITAMGEAQDIQFASEEIGWLITDRGEIFYSSDSGARWDPVGQGGFPPLLGLYFINEGQGWIVGESGTILYVEGQ